MEGEDNKGRVREYMGFSKGEVYNEGSRVHISRGKMQTTCAQAPCVWADNTHMHCTNT